MCMCACYFAPALQAVLETGFYYTCADVALSLCVLSVGHNGEHWKNGCTDQDAVGEDSCGSGEPYIR